jgi:Flp pilus assembly protein TadD
MLSRTESPLWPAALIAAATLLAYIPAIGAGYVWDDPRYVTENPALGSLEGLRQIWLEPTEVVPQYYPLTFTSLWIEHALWGLDPTGYHVVGVLLHTATSLLLYLFFRRIRLPGAWLAAALFALHPVHVESVAWITERKNTLSALFYVLALLAWDHYRPFDSRTRGSGGRAAYPLALLLYACALGSKTVTASLPAAILLLTWWKRGRLTARDLVRTAPMFALGLGLGAVTIWMEQTHVGADWDYGLLDRLLIAGRAVWFYLGKLLFPWELTFIYPKWTIDPAVPWQWLYPIALVGAVVALWTLRDRIGRGPLVALLFFVGTLMPALGLIDVYPMRYSFVADHFQYLASLGPLALVAALATLGLDRLGTTPRRAGLAVCLLVLAVLGVATSAQCRIYKDEETLWLDTVRKNPEAWIGYNNLGTIAAARGDVPRALELYRRVIEIEPDVAEAHFNLGLNLYEQGELELAERHLRRAIELRDDHLPARIRLAMTLRRTGRTEEAETLLRDLRERRPGDAGVHFELGMLLATTGRLPAAIESFETATRLEPNNASAHEFLAQSLMIAGRAAEARTHFERALELDPERPDLAGKLAWLLATASDPEVRDGSLAVRLAEEACRRTDRKVPELLDALAAAYAEQGRYDRAVRVADEAAALAGARGDGALRDSILGRRRIYADGRPFRAG